MVSYQLSRVYCGRGVHPGPCFSSGQKRISEADSQLSLLIPHALVRIPEDAPRSPLAGGALGSADGHELSAGVWGTGFTLKLLQNRPGGARAAWGEPWVGSTSPAMLQSWLPLGRVVCCGPRELGEIGGGRQQISWILDVRKELLVKSLPSWCSRSCLLLPSTRSLGPGPRAARGHHSWPRLAPGWLWSTGSHSGNSSLAACGM